MFSVNGVAWQTIVFVGLQVVHKTAMIVTTRGRGGASVRRGYATTAVWTITFFVSLFAAFFRLDYFSTGVAPGVFIPAILLIGAGISLRIWALTYLRHYFSELIVIRRDHKLITTGPYRYVRHPLHVGLLVQILGFALIAGSWWVYMLAAVSVLVALPRELSEEKTLEAHFGQEYRIYRSGTFGLTDFFHRR